METQRERVGEGERGRESGREVEENRVGDEETESEQKRETDGNRESESVTHRRKWRERQRAIEAYREMRRELKSRVRGVCDGLTPPRRDRFGAGLLGASAVSAQDVSE